MKTVTQQHKQKAMATHQADTMETHEQSHDNTTTRQKNNNKTTAEKTKERRTGNDHQKRRWRETNPNFRRGLGAHKNQCNTPTKLNEQ